MSITYCLEGKYCDHGYIMNIPKNARRPYLIDSLMDMEKRKGGNSCPLPVSYFLTLLNSRTIGLAIYMDE